MIFSPRALVPGTIAALLVTAFTPLAAAQSLAIDSISGPITAHELEAFKAFMATRNPPPNTWGVGATHNALGDGAPGRDVEAMGLMYDATKDLEILNRMVFFADAFLAMRNDLPGGEHRVMWTGNVDKVWPPENPLTPSQPTEITYAGGENSDTIAHIEYCALSILRNPAVWNKTVPDGNPHGYGFTYLERAKTYAQRCSEANDDYPAKYFVQPKTNLIRNPPNWPAGFHTMEAINIQMMVLGGFQRDAEIHELLGDDPARVARYDAIVKTAVRECLDGMKHVSQVRGDTVYHWFYYPSQTTGNETVGHASYDVEGIWRAYNRPVYGLTLAEVAPIANALSDVIYLGNGTFATNVDGTGTTQNYMNGQWALVGVWNDTAFPLVANAAIASKRFANSPAITAPILAMKSRAPTPPDGGAPAPDRPDTGATDADSGEPPDSSLPPPAPDAALADADHLAADAASPSDPSTVRSGCSCRLGVGPANAGFPVLPLVALAALALRRRRGGRGDLS